MNYLQGLCDHPVLITFLFHNTTYRLAIVLSEPQEFATHYPSAFSSLTGFLLSVSRQPV